MISSNPAGELPDVAGELPGAAGEKPGPADERLDLVRRLTAAAPSWGMWKNAGSAISGSGDIDSVVSHDEVDSVERAFATWAEAYGHVPALRCRHAGDLMRVLVAIDRRSGTLAELDMTTRKTWRGSTLFTVPDIERVLEMDARGFRRIRPGAEAILLLFHNGMGRWGTRRQDQIDRRGIARALADDPEGVRVASAWFGRASGAARRLARSVERGEWDRPAALAVELWAGVRAVLEPAGVVRRIWFRVVTKKRCPVIRLSYTPGRGLPDHIDGWLATVTAGHEQIHGG